MKNTDLFADIPAATAMGIQIVRYENGQIELAAPLEPNLNDKGTGFAGSIASLLTLSGWAIITLTLREAGIEADVMVVESTINYRAPARATLHASARLSPLEKKHLLNQLQETNKSRIQISSHLDSDRIPCATLNASYAIARRQSKAV